jgi:hypothetical protein
MSALQGKRVFFFLFLPFSSRKHLIVTLPSRLFKFQSALDPAFGGIGIRQVGMTHVETYTHGQALKLIPMGKLIYGEGGI